MDVPATPSIHGQCLSPRWQGCPWRSFVPSLLSTPLAPALSLSSASFTLLQPSVPSDLTPCPQRDWLPTDGNPWWNELFMMALVALCPPSSRLPVSRDVKARSVWPRVALWGRCLVWGTGFQFLSNNRFFFMSSLFFVRRVRFRIEARDHLLQFDGSIASRHSLGHCHSMRLRTLPLDDKLLHVAIRISVIV